MTRRRGLTLIELLVVLTILVALSGIALRSTIGLEEQARFEATQRAMSEARDAIVARPARQAGAPVITGFVADMGRLPLAPAAPAPPDARELWSGIGLAPFGVYDSSDDLDVRLAFGWRGPYVDLPVGANLATPFRDGWGKELVALTSGVPATNDASIDGLRSVGGTEAPYLGPFDVTIPAHAYEVAPLSVTVLLLGTLPGANDQSVFLRVFAPDPDPTLLDPRPLTLKPWDVGAGVEVTATFSNAADTTLVIPPHDLADPTNAVTLLTAGPRVVRAYFDTNDDGVLDFASDDASEPLPVVLVPGPNVITLTIVFP